MKRGTSRARLAKCKRFASRKYSAANKTDYFVRNNQRWKKKNRPLTFRKKQLRNEGANCFVMGGFGLYYHKPDYNT
jgi:hypothetical protein